MRERLSLSPSCTRLETDAAQRDAVARQHLAAEAGGVDAFGMDAAGRRTGLPFVRRQGGDHAREIDAGRLDVGDLEQRRPAVLQRGFEAAHRHRGDAAALVAIDDNGGGAVGVVRAGQREDDGAFLETTYGERPQRAGDQGLEPVAALVAAIEARQIEPIHDERAHAPAAVGRAVDQTHVLELDTVGLQRIAPAEAGQRRASAQQFAERPGKARRLPAADAKFGVAGRLEIDERDPALEQPDLDVAHFGRTVAFNLGLDPAGRVALHDRHRRDGRTGQRHDDEGCNDFPLHGEVFLDAYH